MTSTTLDARNGDSVATEFLDALARQDWAVVQSLLDQSVSFRVLTPRALREADDDTSAIAWLARWFGDADELTTLRSTGLDDARQGQPELSLSPAQGPLVRSRAARLCRRRQRENHESQPRMLRLPPGIAAQEIRVDVITPSPARYRTVAHRHILDPPLR